MQVSDIIIRLLMIVFFAGAIGYERQFKSKPAGIRTHVLVGVGATVIALIQVSIMEQTLAINRAEPDFLNAIRSDPARLIAQVVSGVGFLGAGTIIVQRKSIVGLTTAASVWSVAGLGLACGMGYYWIAIIGFLVIIITLFALQKIVVIHPVKKIEVHYIHHDETRKFIQNYFNREDIVVKDIDLSVEMKNGHRVCTNFYTIELPKDLDLLDIIEDLAQNENITKVRVVSI